MLPKTIKQEVFSFEPEILEMSHSAQVDRSRLANIRVRIMRLISTEKLTDPAITAFLSVINNLLGEHSIALELARDIIATPPTGDHDSSYGFEQATSMLFTNGFYREAASAIAKYLENFPYDTLILKSGIMGSHLTSQFQQTRSLLGQLSMATKNEFSFPLQRISGHATSTQHLAERYGFTEDDILLRIETAIETLANDGLVPLRMNRIVLDDGSSIMKYFIDADRGISAEVTFKIFDALAEQYDDSGMEILSFSCAPLSDYQGPGLLKDGI